MVDRKKQVISPIMYGLKTIVILAILFYILEASFLAREGLLEEAAIVGFAATLLAFFIYGFSLLLNLGKTGLFSPGVAKKVPGLSLRSTIWEESRDFVLGFTFFLILNYIAIKTEFSIFKYSLINIGSSIFAQAGDVLGTESFKGLFMNTVAAPVSEEIAFFFVMPLIIIFLMNDIANNYGYKVLKNPYVQFLVYAPLISLVFAGFHVGQEGILLFFISAMIFRMILFTIGIDSKTNIMNGVYIGLLFAIGGHMANNIMQTGGLINWIGVMATPDMGNVLEILAGWGTLALIFIALLVFIWGSIEKLSKRIKV